MKKNLKKLLFNKNLPILVLVGVLLWAMYLLTLAMQSSAQFNRLYLWLVGAALLAVFVLVLIIIQRIVWLYLRRRQNAAGSQLTTRMVLMFTGLSLPPVIVVYLFANLLVNRYIDSWFDVKTDDAFRDAITLGQIFLDTQTLANLNTGKDLAEQLADIDPLSQSIYLDRLLDTTKATSLGIYNANGRLLASSQLDPLNLPQQVMPTTAFNEASNNRNYARVESAGDEGLQIRVAVPIASRQTISMGNHRLLQALFPIPEEYEDLTINIETQYHQYNKQTFQRQQLKSTFLIILTIVLLLSVLLAILRAFSSARKLAAPIRLLSEATEAIAEGNFSKIIPVDSKDELGMLVQSFNSMSAQIAASSALAHRAQSEAENQRTYLEKVMSHLSSGVISIDRDLRVRLSNEAALKILHLDSLNINNQNIDYLAMKNATLTPLVTLIKQKVADQTGYWQQEVLIAEDSLRRVLLVRGSQISEKDIEGGGHVIVFDDQTIINQAQRDAAWSEVARRLAHEVKNPLTPIQLSAERMQLKFKGKLSREEDEILNRATQTIVSQVAHLKTLVNAFSDYAKPPELKKELGGLNRIIQEIVDLYTLSQPDIQFKLALSEPEPQLLLDRGRIKQLLTNLIKNAQESADNDKLLITISTRRTNNALVLTIEDNGHGFNADIMEHIFEPYKTTKPGGSGLGLAIVKKIVEEHGGSITAGNHDHGALITIYLPIA
ncbi:PAS domain-containing sensor histidine kinase [Marinicella pacifica]|uniref:histidine kinase n=1 Tax=Marinicella pacifica TaxID=1171543 RepID=A0A917FPK1_9GAMM|nr:ATP-binding protein [Marinicella pacifica]GGF92926.1 PAS domain-containing sensor histidine kinase [Marinicella pacifica]